VLKVPLSLAPVRSLTVAIGRGFSGVGRVSVSVTRGVQNSMTPQPEPRSVTRCPGDTVDGAAVTLIGVAA